MAKKLYVGNLAYQVDDAELRKHFEQAGELMDGEDGAKVIKDKFNQDRSRGFGFVQFKNDDDAEKAIEMLNGKDFAGRDLVVNEARPNDRERR